MLKSESSPIFGNNVKFNTPNKIEKKEAKANEPAKTKPEIKFTEDDSWGWFVDEDDMGAQSFNNHSLGMRRIREEKKTEELEQEDLQFSMDP